MQWSFYRIRTGPWKPGKLWNLKIRIPGLESPGIFVEVLESPGICTYRYIFLIISVQGFSRDNSSEIWVYLCALKVHEFIEKVLEWNVIFEGYSKQLFIKIKTLYTSKMYSFFTFYIVITNMRYWERINKKISLKIDFFKSEEYSKVYNYKISETSSPK